METTFNKRITYEFIIKIYGTKPNVILSDISAVLSNNRYEKIKEVKYLSAYINKVYDLSDMLTLEREDIESEIHKFHDGTKLEFNKDDFYIRNIGFGSSSKPLKEYE